MAWIRCMGGSGAKTVGTDKVPYLFRATPFDANLKKMKLVGGSVAFNQLVLDNLTSGSVNGVDYTVDNVNHTITVDGTASPRATFFISNSMNSGLKGHKVLFLGGSTGNARLGYYHGQMGGGGYVEKEGILSMRTDYGVGRFLILVDNGKTADNEVLKPVIIDLTAMFGSTIADYIYSLEQGTAGAGVAFFRKLFADDYYAYNAGELLSVKPTAHETVGVNQWDEEWENGYYNRSTGVKAGNTDTTYFRSKNYIPCLPNTMYHFKMPLIHASNTTYFAALYYDADKNYLTDKMISSYPNNNASTPQNAYYMTFFVEVGTSGSTYKNDICINLSSSRNGEYEPYKKYTYPLDGTRKVYRKYGIVDLGSITWTYNSQNTMFLSSTGTPSNMRRYNNAGMPSAVCEKYMPTSFNNQANNNVDMTVSIANALTNGIHIKDSHYTDPAVFKTAMSGVYLIYELKTPYYEVVSNPELRGVFKLDSNNKLYCDGDTCEDIVSPMAMMSGGTEAFVDSRAVPVPVGHESTYYSVDFPE